MTPQVQQLQAALAPHLFPASPGYVLGACALALVYWLVIPRGWRAPLLLLVSLAQAFLLTSWQLGLLLALIGFVHLRARRARAGPPGARLSWTIATLLGAFALLKLPFLVASLLAGTAPIFVPVAEVSAGQLLLPMGVSYCLFRLLHVIVEIHRGRFEPPPLHRLTLYVLFFPTFRAGPIERLERFEPAERLTRADFDAGLARVIAGLLKKVVLADFLLGDLYHGWLLQHAGLPPAAFWLLRWYGVSLLVYLDFSGYSDIAIGLSRLLGYRIVENFDYPYLKPNIAAFWRSWHISLHLFIRDYFFFPLFGRATSRRKMMLGLLLAFVCSQVWHALSINFLALGAYHGALLVLWSLYERWQTRRGRRPSSTRLSRVAGALLTFQLVTAGYWLFFWGQAPLGAPRAHSQPS